MTIALQHHNLGGYIPFKLFLAMTIDPSLQKYSINNVIA